MGSWVGGTIFITTVATVEMTYSNTGNVDLGDCSFQNQMTSFEYLRQRTWTWSLGKNLMTYYQPEPDHPHEVPIHAIYGTSFKILG